MRNKNAEITIEEVVKIVLAIIGIIILITLAAALYGIFTKKTDLEQAKQTLKEITGKINTLEENEQDNYLIVTPKDWQVIFYSDDKKQLCICPYYSSSETQKEMCIKQGACEEMKFEIQINDFCVVKNGFIRIENCISLSAIPKSIVLGIKDANYFLRTKETQEFFEIKNSFMNFKDRNSKSIEELIREHLQKNNQEQNLQNQIDLFLTINNIMYGKREGKEGQMGWQLRISKNNENIKIITSPETQGTSYVLKETSMPLEWTIIESGTEYKINLHIGAWYYIPQI
jgi:hypothetical protein